MSTKIELLKKQAAIEQGARLYFDDPRDISDCEANLSLIASEIERIAVSKNVPPKYESVKAWEEAVKNLGKRLVFPAEELSTPEPEQKEEPWPYPDLPVVRTYADIQKLPTKMMKDIWCDKDRRTGQSSEKALRFQAIVNAILAAKNLSWSGRQQ